MNTQQALYIYNSQMLDREPLRVVDFRQLGGTAGPAFPTCIAHTAAAADEFDLAVGLLTGEVVLLSLRAQLRAAASNTRPVHSMCLNVDGSSNASRCVSLAWLPGSAGTAFVAAHRDGAVLLYHKVVGSSSDTKLLARSSSQNALRPPITQLQAPGCGGGVNAAAVSPDGQLVAAACRDGVLRVYACPGGGLVAGFKSYYGGLQCCAWSPDGRYVAAGGEDDLVAVYGLAEHCVVAYCQGHTAWLSGLAFDPWMCHTDGEQQLKAAADGGGGAAAEAAGPAASGLSAFSCSSGSEDRVYRLASVGQDCQLALWDVVVTEEAVAAAQQASSANASPERDHRPGLPPSPSKLRGGGGGGRSSSRSSSPAKRGGGGALSMFRTRSGSAPDPGALPAALATGIIAPPLPRADWPLVTPAVQLRCHPEPLSGVAFTAAGLYTACHGSAVRHWQRPPLTPTAQVRRIDSLQGMA
ncbi:WD repeat-containing 20-like [Micractinium conductrix]|uniref:WD repeat-containing 20-like n=1 Tax=Micractinium conductrix TaxID=554055 RepID=A0A2P6VLA3_9CHLO|nr:WD repeat-containing 20-like [Micractinium conductrix]|eukprot:PSC74864.1 WD repeat-containing 20-like [Micractinium conductrix]